MAIPHISHVSTKALCSLRTAHLGFVVKQVCLKILGLLHASWDSYPALYPSLTTYEV